MAGKPKSRYHASGMAYEGVAYEADGRAGTSNPVAERCDGLYM